MESESKYEKWAKQFKTVQRLFERLAAKKSGSKRTERIYSRNLMLWHEFSGLNPDETVAKWETEAKADLDKALEDWDVKLDLFVNWLVKNRGFTKNVASSVHATVKSLIKYNCRIKLDIGTPSVGIIEGLKPLTIEEFKKIDNVATVQQRWIIRGLKDSGMSREDFIELTYGDIKRDFEKGEQFIHIHVIRRKEQVRYETWLGPNAIEVLRLYLDLRRKRGETINDNTPLTVSNRKPYEKLGLDCLSKIVERLGEKVGVKASPHRIRKLFETYMALEIRHPIILRYWMGHKLKMSDIESRYVIPSENIQRDIYAKAYHLIDLQPKPEHDELLKAEIKARMETLNAEERKRFFAELMTLYGHRAKRWMTEKEFEDLMKESDTNPDGAGLNETFEQIPESQLLQYLKAGWQIVHRLSNGEVIVKR
ncbi:MAG: site-specific integrase [Candidatus Bathyarchaeia archaeon]